MCTLWHAAGALLFMRMMQVANHVGHHNGPLASQECLMPSGVAQVRLFERPDPRDAGRTSAELAVKSFARTGVRPL